MLIDYAHLMKKTACGTFLLVYTLVGRIKRFTKLLNIDKRFKNGINASE